MHSFDFIQVPVQPNNHLFIVTIVIHRRVAFTMNRYVFFTESIHHSFTSFRLHHYSFPFCFLFSPSINRHLPILFGFVFYFFFSSLFARVLLMNILLQENNKKNFSSWNDCSNPLLIIFHYSVCLKFPLRYIL